MPRMACKTHPLDLDRRGHQRLRVVLAPQLLVEPGLSLRNRGPLAKLLDRVTPKMISPQPGQFLCAGIPAGYGARGTIRAGRGARGCQRIAAVGHLLRKMPSGVGRRPTLKSHGDHSDEDDTTFRPPSTPRPIHFWKAYTEARCFLSDPSLQTSSTSCCRDRQGRPSLRPERPSG